MLRAQSDEAEQQRQQAQQRAQEPLRGLAALAQVPAGAPQKNGMFFSFFSFRGRGTESAGIGGTATGDSRKSILVVGVTFQLALPRVGGAATAASQKKAFFSHRQRQFSFFKMRYCLTRCFGNDACDR